MVLAVLVLPGCFRDTGSGCTSLYNFEIPLVASQADGMLTVGDTLSITMHTDNTMIVDLLLEGRTVNFPSFDPFIHYYIISLDSFPVVDGFDVHDITVHTGNSAEVKNGSNLSDILVFLDIDKGETESKLGFDIVLNQRGTFALYGGSLIDYIDSADFIDFPNRCGGRCCSSMIGTCNYNTDKGNIDLLTEYHREVENE